MKNKGSKSLWFSVTAADCEWTYKRGSGNGGQKKNKTNSAVQVFHPPSGARAEAEDTRHQHQNKRIAWRRLNETAEFKSWHKLKIDAGLGLVEVEEVGDDGVKRKRKLNMNEV